MVTETSTDEQVSHSSDLTPEDQVLASVSHKGVEPRYCQIFRIEILCWTKIRLD